MVPRPLRLEPLKIPTMRRVFYFLCIITACCLASLCEKPVNEQEENHWSEEVIMPDNQIWYKTTDDNQMEHIGFAEEDIISHSYSNGRGVIEFKNAVNSLPAKAFTKDWFKLCRVRLPNTIKHIGDEAFYNCLYLEAFDLPENLESIGIAAFSYCGSIDRIDFPSGLKHIGSSAFSQCHRLVSIVLPSGIDVLESEVFHGCSRLENVTLPDGIKSIGDGAFSYCSKLQSIHLPESLESLKRYAFSDSGLKAITLPSGITEISQNLFLNSRLEDITIKGDVKVIERGAFSYTPITSFEVPATVEIIESYAFSECNNLTEISIPEGVREIYGAFNGCAALTTLVLPSSLEIFSNGADNCPMLTDIYCKCTDPKDYSLGSFLPELQHIYVPRGYAKQYKNSSLSIYRDKITEYDF